MAAGKSERLLNLLIMLLVQRHYVAKDRIREILYPDSTSTPSRRCSSGTRRSCAASASPSRSGQMDAYFDDEPGYRVRADELTLPDIS